MILVDDTTLSREALAAQLQREDWVNDVYPVADVSATVRFSLEPQSAVVLVNLTSVHGLHMLRDIHMMLLDMKVIAIAVSDDSEQGLACARAGIAGIVLRSGTLGDLKETVARVMRGETVCPPSVVEALVRHVSDEEPEVRGPLKGGHLTPREREVLVLIDRGLTNKEIARQFGLEVRMVKNHVHNILEKLQVEHRSEAAARLRTARVPELGDLVAVSKTSPEASTS